MSDRLTALTGPRRTAPLLLRLPSPPPTRTRRSPFGFEDELASREPAAQQSDSVVTGDLHRADAVPPGAVVAIEGEQRAHFVTGVFLERQPWRVVQGIGG